MKNQGQTFRDEIPRLHLRTLLRCHGMTIFFNTLTSFLKSDSDIRNLRISRSKYSLYHQQKGATNSAQLDVDCINAEIFLSSSFLLFAFTKLSLSYIHFLFDVFARSQLHCY